MSRIVLLLICCLASWIGCTNTPPKQKQPNILFLAVDDLRPELGAYGNSLIHSPNMDRLAKEGILFRNHFVNVPTCGASRYALLTGRLPRYKKEVSNRAFHDMLAHKSEGPHPESFVHHLRRNNYYTVGIGKITHYVDGKLMPQSDTIATGWELPHSWDEMLLDVGKWGSSWGVFFGYADGSNRNDLKKNVKPYEAAEVEDEGYPDGLTANLAIEKLHELKDKKQPFFLGVGFFKPHLPFNAPQKYWDLYDPDQIPLTTAPELPQHVHRASLHGSGEFNQYKLGEEKNSLDKPLSDSYARKLTQGYYACVSYTDALIGKVLKALEETGLAENTIVVLWGDHGWNLGDHRIWGKHTIFERSLKSPLIVKLPCKAHAGTQIEKVVSSIDIYPTLTELAGIQRPDSLDGREMKALWESPDFAWKEEAFGYYRKGISLRTERYRLMKYFREQSPTIELFDHEIDPYETINIAAEYPQLTDSLLQIWEKGNSGLFQE